MSAVPDPGTTVTTPPEPVQYEGGAAAPAAAQKDAPYTSQYAHIDLCLLHQLRYRFLNITNTILLPDLRRMIANAPGGKMAIRLKETR